MKLVIGLFILVFMLNSSLAQEMKISVGYTDGFDGKVFKGNAFYKMNSQGKPVLLRYSIPGVDDGEGSFPTNARVITDDFDPSSEDGLPKCPQGYNYTHYVRVGCCDGIIWIKGWRE
jgi:hypothetical protein